MPHELGLGNSISSAGSRKAESGLRYKICTKTHHPTSKLLNLKVGSPAWIRTTIHGSKGRCPTIRRPGKRGGNFTNILTSLNGDGLLGIRGPRERGDVESDNPPVGSADHRGSMAIG